MRPRHRGKWEDGLEVCRELIRPQNTAKHHYRTTVRIQGDGIDLTAQGDHPTRRDSEKLAALCAMYQLDGLGVVRFYPYLLRSRLWIFPRDSASYVVTQRLWGVV